MLCPVEDEDLDGFIKELEGGIGDESSSESVVEFRRSLERQGRIFEPSGRTDPRPRPSDLTESQRNELLDLLKIQTPEADACYCVGLDPATFQRWMRMSSTDEECRHFRMDVLQAQGRGVADQTRRIFDGQDRLGTARFLVERKRPTDFGPRPAIGISVSASVGSGARAPLDAIEDAQSTMLIDILGGAGISLPPDVESLLRGEAPALPETRVLEAHDVDSETDDAPGSGS